MDESVATMTLRVGTTQIGANRPRSRTAFTLIELICVMSLLIIVVGVVSPSLSGFFRGRNLDSEVRRFFSLTLYGQQRAISEGMPMLLWVDPDERRYGLQAESSFQQQDDKSVEYQLDENVAVQFERNGGAGGFGLGGGTGSTPGFAQRGKASSTARAAAQASRFGRNSGILRFEADGSIDPSSPVAIGFYEQDRTGLRESDRRKSVWVGQRQNGLSYEIQTNQTAYAR